MRACRVMTEGLIFVSKIMSYGDIEECDVKMDGARSSMNATCRPF